MWMCKLDQDSDIYCNLHIIYVQSSVVYTLTLRASCLNLQAGVEIYLIRCA